jgi:glycosyltransferase involved in cell wall biosynthesis
MISDFYPPYLGGVEMLVHSLSHELAARGHEVVVATLATGELPAFELDGPVRVHRIRCSAQRMERLFATPARPWAPPVPDPEAVGALRRIAARERPEVVHGHDWLARSYLPLKRSRRASEGGGKRALVMSLHYFTLTCPKKSLMYRGAPCSGPALRKCVECAGEHYGRAKGTVVVLGQRAFSKAEAARVDLFLPVSAATAEGNGLPGSGLPYQVMRNFVPAAPDAGQQAHLLDQLPGEPFLLFVGDIRENKGVNVLLAAYRGLADAPPLVLLGKVWPETPAELPHGVTLLRDWPNAAARAAMRRCLALVVPSVWPEPAPIVVTEALAAGRPVVGSEIGGIPEIVRHEREGLLVRPQDSDGLKRALARICDEPGLRARLAAGATTRAQRFSPESVVPLVEQAYERALAK